VTRRVRPAAGLLLAAVLALGGVLATATAASAHDRLEATSPEQGSSVATPPAAITLSYNNPVFKLGSRVQVIGPAGDVAAGEPEFTEREVTQPIRPDAPAGEYTVRWQVTSSDGHPIAGTWSFTVRQAAAAPGTAEPSAGATTTAPTTETPAPTATGGVSATGETGAEDEGSSTGLVIGVTAVAAVVLLGAAGVVAWTSRRRPD
jgi:methionine-rich copper-binding protein CopC